MYCCYIKSVTGKSINWLQTIRIHFLAKYHYPNLNMGGVKIKKPVESMKYIGCCLI